MSKEELIYNAKLAEHSERYADMITHMKHVIDETGGDLNNEERTLLSVAYKQAVGERRNAWRIIGSYEEKQKSRGSEHLDLISEYKKRIEKELHGLCMELINLIDAKLIPGASNDEVQVFYLKMKGDYYRYMAEAGEAEEIQKSYEAYMSASNAAKNLPVNNPVRLGLALNFSVFYYELKKEPTMACELAKTTFDEALPTLEELDERSYKEATSILGLIKDNLTLWTSEDA
jgi:14-3-3 protein epsilon